MFFSLLQYLLKPTERPFLSALVSTIASFLLCVSPFLLMILGDIVMHYIHEWLMLLPHFEWEWLNSFIEWLMKKIAWISGHITLLVMPVTILLLGTIYLITYARRSSIKTLIAIYVFKRATEPLLALHFAAWFLMKLIIYVKFDFLEHLLSEKSLQDFGSGEIVALTLIMWLSLKVAFTYQLGIIRKEKSATGSFAAFEQIRLMLLDWVEKSQSESQQKIQAKDVKA